MEDKYEVPKDLKKLQGNTLKAADKISAQFRKKKLRDQMKGSMKGAIVLKDSENQSTFSKSLLEQKEKKLQANQEKKHISIGKGKSMAGYGKELDKYAPGSTLTVGKKLKLKKPKKSK